MSPPTPRNCYGRCPKDNEYGWSDWRCNGWRTVQDVGPCESFIPVNSGGVAGEFEREFYKHLQKEGKITEGPGR